MMYALILGGCAFWVGEADMTPYPITERDVLRDSPDKGPALPAGFSTPTIRSVAPDPVLLEVSGDGYPLDVEVGALRTPEAFAHALRQAAGGSEGGAEVAVVIERFQTLCMRRTHGKIDGGAHLVAEGSVRFGDGAWQRVEVTRHARDCKDPEALQMEAGAAFAGEIGRLAANADPGKPERPFPGIPGDAPVLCVARDARPSIERYGQRAAEAFSMYTLGTGLTTLRGTRMKSHLFAGDAPGSDESQRLTDTIERALKAVLPGLTTRDELCPLVPPRHVDVPMVWVRLDHQWVEQYVRSTEWTTEISNGFFSIVYSNTDQASTEPFAYWRAGLALCVEDVCKGTTLAGTNRVSGAILDEPGSPAGWSGHSKEALHDLGDRARGTVAAWLGKDQPPPF